MIFFLPYRNKVRTCLLNNNFLFSPDFCFTMRQPKTRRKKRKVKVKLNRLPFLRYTVKMMKDQSLY